MGRIQSIFVQTPSTIEQCSVENLHFIYGKEV